MIKGFFVASTGQNIGKTTISLGLVSLLKKRFSSVGFMKPVGQQFLKTEEGTFVDKDILIFRKIFGINDPCEEMSPLVLPPGFTRNFLDGKIDTRKIAARIKHAYVDIAGNHEAVVVEGTGHVGVGSIIGFNNAQVAAMLGLPIILVASGGIGAPFDALSLNKVMCEKMGIPIAGIVLNQVDPNHFEKSRDYMTKALKTWRLPLLGAVPYDPALSAPTLAHFAALFKVPFLAGEEKGRRSFEKLTLVAASPSVFEQNLKESQMIITPASREDIILAALTKHWENSQKMKFGFLFTESKPLKISLLEQIKNAEIPTLHVPFETAEVMKEISSYTAKMTPDDMEKIDRARYLVESSINLTF